MRALFLGSTHAGRSIRLHRWECPICRSRALPECRFNLSARKTGGKWNCRFCKTELELIR